MADSHPDQQDAPEDGEPGVLPAPGASLVVRRGPAVREVITLRGNSRITIGRSSSNHIVLSDEKCSRQHCEVFPRRGVWVLRDLGSRNGIFVNEEPVKEVELALGVVVGVGDWQLEYAASAAPAEIPLESDSFVCVERATDSNIAPRLDQEGTRPGETGLPQLFLLTDSLANAGTEKELAETSLHGIIRAAGGSVGCVLLGKEPGSMRTAAARLPGGDAWRAVINYLVTMVCTSGDALRFEDSDPGGVTGPTIRGAVAVPIRTGINEDRGPVEGVVLLFGGRDGTPLAHEHLEFTVAVAARMADRLGEIRDRTSLLQSSERAAGEARELREQLEVETELVRRSQTMQELRRTIGRIARTDATVLVRGESGVGKELVARAVHFNSQRKERPFVCVNCAALSESLLESELFGHEKGAFTGAGARKIGKFEAADGGTLFLDEVGEMSAEVQSKFLRVLEGHPFERVGGSEAITSDVRVVTATNRDLEAAVEEGSFRGDLYFRLHVIQIDVPPLRDRFEDIPEIVAFFIDRFRRKSATSVERFGSGALAELKRYPWPGNVRELKNVVERAVILSDGPVIDKDEIVMTGLKLPSSNLETADFQMPAEGDRPSTWSSLAELELTLDAVEQRYVSAVLEKTDWNKSAASRLLEIERTTLDRKIKKYDLKKAEG